MEPEDSAAHAQPKGEACIVPARPLWFDHCNRRHVVPYMHTLRVRAKGRWLGRTVVDVFAAEFQHHTRAYYSAAADSGRLYVEFDPTGGNHRSHKKRPRARNDGTVVGLQNGEPNHDETDNNCGLAWVRRSLDHKIERCDVIVHVIHKHELSVFSTAIPVVEAVVLDPGRPFHGVVVVNKPCSLPTHSSGRYHFNACLSMLEAWLVAPPAAAPTDSSSSSQAGMLAATAYRPVAYSSLACFGPGVSVLDQAALRAYATAAAVKHADGRVELRACHRLDKATSGVLICALTREAASFVGDLLAAKTKSVEACLDAWLASGDAGRGAADGRCAATAGLAHMVSRFGILKTYVARVDGEFPMRGSRGDDGCALPLHGLCPMEDGCEDADWAIVEPLAVDERWQKRSGGDERSGDGDEDESGESAHVCGLAAATKEVQAPKVQTAVTLCKRLQYVEASRESIVVCMPLTGRTHQIRRHLAHVGFPIANDTKYNPRLTKGLCAAAEVPVYFDFAELPPEVQRQTVRDPLCSECKQELPVTKSGDMESVIFLHAWRYRVQWGDEAAHVAAPAASKTFETALPEWACCGGA